MADRGAGSGRTPGDAFVPQPSSHRRRGHRSAAQRPGPWPRERPEGVSRGRRSLGEGAHLKRSLTAGSHLQNSLKTAKSQEWEPGLRGPGAKHRAGAGGGRAWVLLATEVSVSRPDCGRTLQLRKAIDHRRAFLAIACEATVISRLNFFFFFLKPLCQMPFRNSTSRSSHPHFRCHYPRHMR